jgi:hypothetical protein
MKRPLLIASVAMLLLVPGCGKKPDWQEFSSSAGKYSILMPATPKHQSQPVLTLTAEMDVAIVGTTEFGAAYTNLPAGSSFDYAASVQGMKNGYSGTVTKERDWTFEGVKGKEAEMTVTKPRTAIASVRIVVLNNRLYQILVVGSDATLDNPDVKKFLDSFKVTK